MGAERTASLMPTLLEIFAFFARTQCLIGYPRVLPVLELDDCPFGQSVHLYRMGIWHRHLAELLLHRLQLSVLLLRVRVGLLRNLLILKDVVAVICRRKHLLLLPSRAVSFLMLDIPLRVLIIRVLSLLRLVAAKGNGDCFVPVITMLIIAMITLLGFPRFKVLVLHRHNRLCNIVLVCK